MVGCKAPLSQTQLDIGVNWHADQFSLATQSECHNLMLRQAQSGSLEVTLHSRAPMKCSSLSTAHLLLGGFLSSASTFPNFLPSPLPRRKSKFPREFPKFPSLTIASSPVFLLLCVQHALLNFQTGRLLVLKQSNDNHGQIMGKAQ